MINPDDFDPDDTATTVPGSRLGHVQHDVLDTLSSLDEGATIRQLATWTGQAEESVRKAVEALYRQGIVDLSPRRRKGPPRSRPARIWQINERGLRALQALKTIRREPGVRSVWTRR